MMQMVVMLMDKKVMANDFFRRISGYLFLQPACTAGYVQADGTGRRYGCKSFSAAGGIQNPGKRSSDSSLCPGNRIPEMRYLSGFQIRKGKSETQIS